MKTVSNDVKTYLGKPTTQRKGRILVGSTYYDVYNVEYYADCYEDGNVIGNAIASQLSFDMDITNKFDTFKFYEGVYTGLAYEYIDMGTFTVFDDSEVNDFKKHIVAFDNLLKFNVEFVSDGEYPKTLYEELQSVCLQAGVTLTNQTIPNGSFEIENNQFINRESLKTVLKEICKISGTYAIIKNDQLILQLSNTTNVELDKSYYKPINWKRRTCGINQVIIGMEDVDGEYVVKQDDNDIALNGIHKLVINDSMFGYTQAKRQLLIDDLYDQVHGFGYVPYELEGEWLPYLDIGDIITIDNVETIVLRIDAKSPQAVKSKMSAPAVIDSVLEYVDNTETIQNRLRKTEIEVDKANQTITQTVSTINEINTNLVDLTTVTNNNYQQIITKFDDYVPENQYVTLENTVTQLQTDTYTKTEINTKLTDGSVTKVMSTAGTFDSNGLTIEKTNAKTKGNFNETGITVMDATGSTNSELLFAGYDETLNETIVRTKNINVSKYLTIGTNSRIEDYESGTGVFYVGG